MDELASALDALAADDLFDISGPALLDRTRNLVAARNRLDAELARTVRRAETTQAPEHDGLKAMTSWLAGHCRIAGATAAQIVRAGRVIEQLPAVAAAFAHGAVGADQIAVIAPVVQPGNLAKAADQGIDLGAVDQVLAQTAATQRHDRLRQVVHHYLARLDPDGPEPDPTEGRSLTIAKNADGSGTGRFTLDAVGLEKVQAVLE